MNKDKLQTWALLAEVIGGIAIIFTLIFVGLEIRSNTEVTRAENYANLLQQLSELRLSIASDPVLLEATELSRTYVSGSLSNIEFRRAFSILSSVWGIFETAYFYNERGLLGPEEWSRFERSICAGNDSSDAWEELVKPRVSEKFAYYVENECD